MKITSMKMSPFAVFTVNILIPHVLSNTKVKDLVSMMSVLWLEVKYWKQDLIIMIAVWAKTRDML